MSEWCRMSDRPTDRPSVRPSVLVGAGVAARRGVAGRLFDARVAVHHHGARDAMRCDAMRRDAWDGWMDGCHGRAWMRMAAHGVRSRRDRRRRRWRDGARDGGFGVLPGARAWVRRDCGGVARWCARARGGARWCVVVLVSRRAGVASASPMRGRDGDARGMTAQ